jgi:hypothetical protein
MNFALTVSAISSIAETLDGLDLATGAQGTLGN